jgi:hypothetical protein
MTVDELRHELEQEAQNDPPRRWAGPEGQMAWKPHPRSMSMGSCACTWLPCPADREDFGAGLVRRRHPIPPGSEEQGRVWTAHAESLATQPETARTADAALADPWKMTKGGREVMS